MYDYSRGSVTQLTERKGKPWRGWIRFKDESGKWRTITKMFDSGTVKNKTQALKALDDWRHTLEEEQSKEQTDMSHAYVVDYLSNYIDTLETGQSVEPSTIKGYRTIQKIIERNMKPVRLDELKPSHVQTLEADLLQQGKSLSTVGKVHRLLKTMCKHAVNMDDLIKNPVDPVKPPKRPSVQPNALDAQSLAKLAQYLADSEATPTITGIALALFAGLRVQECCGLKWSDVDLDRSQITISEAIGESEGGKFYSKDPKNKTSRRTIHIPAQLTAILESRRAIMKTQAASLQLRLHTGAYVLSDDLENFYSPNRLSKNWRVIAEALNVKGTQNQKVTFHDLRHTFATVAVKEHVDIKTVASMMGHASAKMTLDIYASDDEQAKQQAAETITRAYERQAQVIKFKRAVDE